MAIVSFVSQLWSIRALIFVPLGLLLPLVLILDPDDVLNEECTKIIRCAYIMIFMAILWLTESIPIPATALIPVFMFPLMEVVPGKTIASKYVNDSTMLFLGGLLLAVALEEWNLHKRIALTILRFVGSQPDTLMIGLMLPTWFLSMWISNTAATAMMIPIITAVTSEVLALNDPGTDLGLDNLAFQNSTDEIDHANANDIKKTPIADSTEVIIRNTDDDDESDASTGCCAASMSSISKGLALCVAYAANVGGIATLTGTPPNIVLKGQADEFYQKAQENYDGSTDGYSGINFANWMAFGFPLSLITLVLGYIWLNICFVRFSCFRKDIKRRKPAIQKVIMKEYHKLGSITFAEVMVLICFITLACLWIFRDPPDVDDDTKSASEKGWGWGDSFKPGYARDATASILVGVALFVLPAKMPNVFFFRRFYTGDEEALKSPKYTALLSWDAVHKKLPWGVIVLLGGGFALAAASTESGLSAYVGQQLEVFKDMEPWVMNLVLSLLVAAATEVTSNTATATLLLPIVAELAISIGANPLYLMISTAVACSFAFMLPVATPPNAIVFATGYLRIWHMAGAGLVMNIIAVLCLTLAINTWGTALFDLDVVPDMFVNATHNIEKLNCSWPF